MKAVATTQDTQARLLAPFSTHDVRWRIVRRSHDQARGFALPYVDARVVQRRLDEVFGWDGWTARYAPFHETAILCSLSVRLPDGEWITKEDGSDATEIEPTKGGISEALRRTAASGFGIGRYLYDLSGQWVDLTPQGDIAAPPTLPEWAIPPAERAPSGDDRPDPTPPAPNCPRCGRPMTARAGRGAARFWGCTEYPACRGTLPLRRSVPLAKT